MPLYQDTTVYAVRAKSTAGQSIGNATTDTVVFGTVDYDLRSAYNASTGEYTCPITGYLQVSCNLLFQSSLYAGGERAFIAAYLNGSQLATLGAHYNIGAATTAMDVSGTGTIPVTAGDVVTVRTGNNRTAGATLLNTNGTTVWAAFQYIR